MSKSEIIADIDTTPKPRKRLFETGEMKLLVLYFISQQPKFSYDIIKDVANLVGGNYKPSTGTICPTINYLEEQGYTEVHLTEDDRKQYHIHQTGLVHLAEQKHVLEKILLRFNTRNQIQNNEQYSAIKIAMDQLKSSLKGKILYTELTVEQIENIAKKIDNTAKEIAKL